MARPRKNQDSPSTLLQEVKQKNASDEEVDINEMPLETLGDYVRYNKRARAANHKLRVCRYPIKQCPEELHPKQRIIFQRKDQPKNPLPVLLSNEMIHFKKTLIPGQAYDLPLCIIDYLASKGVPIWDRVDNPDGSYETRKVSMDPRFSLRTVYSQAV